MSSSVHRIILLRHGESTWNRENRFTGWTDVELTDNGLREARAAGGLRSVAGLPQVRLPYLHGGNVTDAGLRHLEAMQGLRRLLLRRCPNVTEVGVERLRKALPDCQIERD